MDSLCLKPGIVACTVAGTTPVGKPSVSAAPIRRNGPWGFSFKYPLRSLWPGGKRYDAIALDDAVVAEEKERKENVVEGDEDGNWVMKIMRVRSAWGRGEREVIEGGDGDDLDDCDVCRVYDDDDDKVEFDRSSFSKLLRRVSLGEARLYARMSYLGNLAYCIPQIKPKNLLKIHGLRFVTSSLEKKEMAMKAEKEKAAKEVVLKAEKEKKTEEVAMNAEKEKTAEEVAVEAEIEKAPEDVEVKGESSEEIKQDQEQETKPSKLSPSAAYNIAASAASYLHSHTMSIISFRSFKSDKGEEESEENYGFNGASNLTDEEMASLRATTNSMTAVVAAKEEVKQAVADDLNSTSSSPCEWYIGDDDLTGTRYFVIQGSESLASWQANLLFEPIEFEGLDIPVHRGIYEAAKGMYEQMLPEVHAHLNAYGDRATFRFTGHSLGGSLSLLINLMLLKRGEVPPSSLLPVITFGSPSIMCGGDRLLRELGLPRSHVQSITMHRDIVPRAFSCNYPSHVAELLKAVNGNFRNHPCLNNQKLLYAPMGEFLILQPDEKYSPSHDLLPPGSGLYLMNCPALDTYESEKKIRAAQSVFLNSPHPLEILSDRSAYGSDGTVQRDHDMNSYLKSVRSVIRQELSQIRRAKREERRKIWWPLVASRVYDEGIVLNRPESSSSHTGHHKQFNFSGILQTGTRSLKRFSRLVASQNVHLLVVLLVPARLLVLGTFGVIKLVY